MGSGSLLKMTYIGHTTFRLETEEMSLLINPGIWDEKPVVPSNHDVRVIVATNHASDSLGNATEIATNAKAWILGNEATIQKAGAQGAKPWLLHTLRSEVPYEIPGMKLTPFSLQRKDLEYNVAYCLSFWSNLCSKPHLLGSLNCGIWFFALHKKENSLPNLSTFSWIIHYAVLHG